MLALALCHNVTPIEDEATFMAFSRRRFPIQHHGQIVSDTTSIFTSRRAWADMWAAVTWFQERLLTHELLELRVSSRG